MKAHKFNIKAFASSINLYIINRYPNSSVLSFCNEITELLEYNVANNRGHTLLLGDFNIHLDDIQDLNTISFTDLLESQLTKQSNFSNTHSQPCTGSSDR